MIRVLVWWELGRCKGNRNRYLINFYYMATSPGRWRSRKSEVRVVDSKWSYKSSYWIARSRVRFPKTTSAFRRYSRFNIVSCVVWCLLCKPAGSQFVCEMCEILLMNWWTRCMVLSLQKYSPRWQKDGVIFKKTQKNNGFLKQLYFMLLWSDPMCRCYF